MIGAAVDVRMRSPSPSGRAKSFSTNSGRNKRPTVNSGNKVRIPVHNPSGIYRLRFQERVDLIGDYERTPNGKPIKCHPGSCNELERNSMSGSRAMSSVNTVVNRRTLRRGIQNIPDSKGAQQ